MTTRTTASRRGGDRGQTMVEFALALPLLIIIVVGIFDFGHAVYMSNTISNAARIANRVAIVDQNEAAIDAEARQQAVAVALADDDIDVTVGCAEVQIGCLVRIDIEHRYIPATPVINLLVGEIVLKATSEMPIERVYASP